MTLAKGLEYDHVIVVEPARIAHAEARGLQRLYVALTRAVSRLTVLYSEPLPGSPVAVSPVNGLIVNRCSARRVRLSRGACGGLTVIP